MINKFIIYFLILFFSFLNSSIVNSSEISLSNFEVCNFATSRSSSYGNVWVAIDGANGKYVKEAFLRGLFCKTYEKASDKNICLMYSNSIGNLSEFDKLKWHREIKRRKINCGFKDINNYESDFWKNNLKVEKKEEEENLLSDNEKPEIKIKFKTTNDKVGIVRGLVNDNNGIKTLIIEDETVFFNKNGEFEYSTFVPFSGLELKITVIDKSGLSNSKIIKFSRKKTNIKNSIFFKKLNPLSRKVKKNNDALALIIGVSSYENTNAKALYADNDALLFRDYASDKLGIPENKIKVLVNDGADEKDILLAVKDWIARSTKSGKTDIYVFFAGHGLSTADGKDMFLLPYDGLPRLLQDSAIKRDQLFADIQKANPKSVTVFLDTCYSGTTRGTDMLIASRPIAIRALKQSIPNNFTVFSAAAGDQTSKPLEEAKHGMFSYFLMKGMEGDADTNADNKITAQELHAYVKENVTQQSSGSQTPELQGNKDRVLVQFN
jgi:hypothetical protein